MPKTVNNTKRIPEKESCVSSTTTLYTERQLTWGTHRSRGRMGRSSVLGSDTHGGTFSSCVHA